MYYFCSGGCVVAAATVAVEVKSFTGTIEIVIILPEENQVG